MSAPRLLVATLFDRVEVIRQLASTVTTSAVAAAAATLPVASVAGLLPAGRVRARASDGSLLLVDYGFILGLELRDCVGLTVGLNSGAEVSSEPTQEELDAVAARLVREGADVAPTVRVLEVPFGRRSPAGSLPWGA